MSTAIREGCRFNNSIWYIVVTLPSFRSMENEFYNSVDAALVRGRTLNEHSNKYLEARAFYAINLSGTGTGWFKVDIDRTIHEKVSVIPIGT